MTPDSISISLWQVYFSIGAATWVGAGSATAPLDSVADRGVSGALGPAILWGPLQGCDPTFHSWGVGAL